MPWGFPRHSLKPMAECPSADAISLAVIPGPPISGLPEIGIFVPKSAIADLVRNEGAWNP
jgi:hypothetical protein